MGGYAGSGKTTLAQAISKQLGAVYLDKDELAGEAAGQMLKELGLSPSDRDSEQYFELVRPREYEMLMEQARKETATGKDVVLDAPFLRELPDPEWSERLLLEWGEVEVVWVQASPEVMLRNMQFRSAPRDQLKLQGWAEYAAGIDIELIPEAIPFHLVENNGSKQQLIEAGVEAVSKAKVARRPG